MIDFNKPVQTRSGYLVRVLCTDRPGKYPVIYYTTNTPERTISCDLNGRATPWSDKSEDDLINVPERVERWLVMDHPNDLQPRNYSRKQMLDKGPHQIRITYEDGKPVAVALEAV